MKVDNDTLLEFLREEDFNDFTLFEKVIKKIIKSGDKAALKTVFLKLQLSFLSNGELYRTKILERFYFELKDIESKEITLITFDSLVGNYIAIYWLIKKKPIINQKTAQDYINVIGSLQYIEDVCCFGFPFVNQISLQLTDGLPPISQNQMKSLSLTAKVLFQLDILRKSKSMVESFQRIFGSTDIHEDTLKANLIAALLNKDVKEISFIFEKFGGPNIHDIDDIISNFDDIWKCFEKLSIPVYFDAQNLRFNGVLFNDNFFFVKYTRTDGTSKILFPFDQIELEDIRSVYDPSLGAFYYPKETFGMLKLERIYSIKRIETIQTPDVNVVAAVKSMSEDEINSRIRKILQDPNECHHSPVEVTDVFTQYIFVNNPDDLRWAGIIAKGCSFENVTSKQLIYQVVRACFSPIQVILLVYVNKIQHEALCEFVKLCDHHRKNYGILDENSLARLFVSYNVL